MGRDGVLVQGPHTAVGRSAARLLDHHLYSMTPEYNAVNEFKAATATAYFNVDTRVAIKSSSRLVPRFWVQVRALPLLHGAASSWYSLV